MPTLPLPPPLPPKQHQYRTPTAPRCKTFEQGVPFDAAAEASLDEYEWLDYEKALAKAFIALGEEEQAALGRRPCPCTRMWPEAVIKERLARDEDPLRCASTCPCACLMGPPSATATSVAEAAEAEAGCCC